MKLEIDLDKIKKLYEKQDKENWNIRLFLKGHDATIDILKNKYFPDLLSYEPPSSKA